MKYLEKIQNDLKDAMKAKDAVRMRTLRSLLAKLKEKKIELIKELEEAEELQVFKKAAKEREESAATYEQNHRDDLASAEREELVIIQSYLPAEMDDAALKMTVEKVIAETGVTSARDLGKVMGPVMKAVSGLADGKRVQAMVKSLLGN